MYWGQNHAYTGVKIISVYWTDCSGILAAVELPRPIAPPPGWQGGPAEGTVYRRQKSTRFHVISYHSRGSKLNWPGVIGAIDTEKTKKNFNKNMQRVAMMW